MFNPIDPNAVLFQAIMQVVRGVCIYRVTATREGVSNSNDWTMKVLTPDLDRDSAINLRDALRSGEVQWDGSEMRRKVGDHTGVQGIVYSIDDE